MRTGARFLSRGTSCAAWHYQGRTGQEPRPCVVMAHGFGGTRRMGLAPFAERFAEAGVDALVFDYRHFGDSEGQPRQLLSIDAQLADWRAAIAKARVLPGVDPGQVVLWGTSFSGGHVVVAAADDPDVAAVVSQVGMYDGLAAFRIALSSTPPHVVPAGVAFATADAVRRRLGGRPLYVPIAAEPGRIGMLTSPDSLPGFRRLAGDEMDNRVAAEIALHVGRYRPVRHADRVRCPMLVQVAEHDALVSVAAAEETAARAGGPTRLRRYPLGHFDVYFDDGFERVVTDQLDFLREALGLRAPRTKASG